MAAVDEFVRKDADDDLKLQGRVNYIAAEVDKLKIQEEHKTIQDLKIDAREMMTGERISFKKIINGSEVELNFSNIDFKEFNNETGKVQAFIRNNERVYDVTLDNEEKNNKLQQIFPDGVSREYISMIKCELCGEEEDKCKHQNINLINKIRSSIRNESPLCYSCNKNLEEIEIGISSPTISGKICYLCGIKCPESDKMYVCPNKSSVEHDDGDIYICRLCINEAKTKVEIQTGGASRVDGGGFALEEATILSTKAKKDEGDFAYIGLFENKPATGPLAQVLHVFKKTDVKIWGKDKYVMYNAGGPTQPMYLFSNEHGIWSINFRTNISGKYLRTMESVENPWGHTVNWVYQNPLFDGVYKPADTSDKKVTAYNEINEEEANKFVEQKHENLHKEAVDTVELISNGTIGQNYNMLGMYKRHIGHDVNGAPSYILKDAYKLYLALDWHWWIADIRYVNEDGYFCSEEQYLTTPVGANFAVNIDDKFMKGGFTVLDRSSHKADYASPTLGDSGSGSGATTIDAAAERREIDAATAARVAAGTVAAARVAASRAARVAAAEPAAEPVAEPVAERREIDAAEAARVAAAEPAAEPVAEPAAESAAAAMTLSKSLLWNRSAI